MRYASFNVLSLMNFFKGDGMVIHLSCDAKRYTDAVRSVLEGLLMKPVVKIDTLSDALNGCDAVINNKMDKTIMPRDPEAIVNAAKSMLGKEGYSLLFKNCETMCNSWRYDVPTSYQAVKVLELVIAVAAGIFVGAITKELFEDKIGFTWATVAGVTTGTATTAVILYAVLDSAVTDSLAMGFAKIAAGATNVAMVVAVPLVLYGAYRLVRSETFKNTVKNGRLRCSTFIEKLLRLVTRSLHQRSHTA
ncbi:uncharacterized protein LOC125662454 isoform X2 [Ostrea edulis]|uniref:uncharacterized protein LOC125662454 isoform X2 n=1 Tax=Ostrea edulis TaxID=37623 RepID=UPI0024AF4D11|nr:uncharacterized protein LOC125662454 isoform X2 [Ostrea edulis]